MKWRRYWRRFSDCVWHLGQCNIYSRHNIPGQCGVSPWPTFCALWHATTSTVLGSRYRHATATRCAAAPRLKCQTVLRTAAAVLVLCLQARRRTGLTTNKWDTHARTHAQDSDWSHGPAGAGSRAPTADTDWRHQTGLHYHSEYSHSLYIAWPHARVSISSKTPSYRASNAAS